MRRQLVYPALGVLLFSSQGVCGESPELVEAREVLKKANIPTDDQSLLAYFQKQTLTPDDIKRLSQLIPQLGDNDFGRRERATAIFRETGQVALPILRTALQDPDPEIARRAQELITAMADGGFVEQTCAVAHVLQDRKPTGACPVLFAYLPMVQEEAVKEAVLAALAAVAVRDGKALDRLVKGLSEKEPAARGGAAMIVARYGSEEQRKHVAERLNDPALEVRLAAAQGLIAAKEKAGVPALISLLTQAPPTLALQAEDLLRRLAGDKAPTNAWNEKDREKSRATWETWWNKDGPKLDWANADVELDFLDVGTAVKRAVLQFYDLILGKKTIPANKIMDVPFDFFGQTIATMKELESRYSTNKVGQKYVIEIKKVSTLTAYARTPKANKDAVAKVGTRSARVVEIDMRDATTVHKIMVFVSVSGGQARVIGTRRFDEVP